MKTIKRIRFKINQAETGYDYRPMVWPIKYPYWCSGESCGLGEDDYYILIAYVDKVADIKRLWPEAYDIEEPEICNEITFTSRFPKPEWFDEKSVEINKL